MTRRTPMRQTLSALACVLMLVATAAVASPCRAGDCGRPVPRKAKATVGCCDKEKAAQTSLPRASLETSRCDCCASARVQPDLALPAAPTSEVVAPLLLDGFVELGLAAHVAVSPRVVRPHLPRASGVGPPALGPSLVGTTILIC